MTQAESGPRARRLNALLGAEVVLRDGGRVGYVNDVRLTGGPYLQDYVVEGLIVGRSEEGSLLGYDRRETLGPWLVRVLVAWFNRGTTYVPWRAVRRIDWDAGRVEVDRVEPLTELRPER
jgi:sporulation protein YlmC with PRC-barrel domain